MGTYIKNIIISIGFGIIFSKTILHWQLTNLLNCLQHKLCSLSNQSRGRVKTFRALKLLQKVFFKTKNKIKQNMFRKSIFSIFLYVAWYP